MFYDILRYSGIFCDMRRLDSRGEEAADVLRDFCFGSSDCSRRWVPSIERLAGVDDRVGIGCDDFALLAGESLRLGTSGAGLGRSGVVLGGGVQIGIEVGRTR